MLFMAALEKKKLSKVFGGDIMIIFFPFVNMVMNR